MNLKVIKDLVLNNLSQGLQFGFQWLLNIVVLKTLGVDFFGEYAFYYSISSFLMPILAFGSYIYLMKESFVNKDDAISNFVVSSQVQIVFFLIISILSCFLFLFFRDMGTFSYLVLSLFNGYLLSLNTLIFIFHKSVGDFKNELKVNIIKALLIFILIIFVLITKNKISNVLLLSSLLLINILSFFCSVFISKILSYRDLRRVFSFSYIEIKKRVFIQRYFGIQDIFTASFVQGGMLILPLFVMDEIYGMYRGLLLIVAPFALLNLAFAQVLLNQIKNATSYEKGRIFHSLQKIAIPILLVILGVMYVFREFILDKIAKLELTETINQAYIGVLFVILFSFVYSGYEMLLVALNKQKMRFIIMVVGALVNLITIFTLLPKYGIIGAIGTNVISAFIVFILIFSIGEKELKKV
ncbi:lipopolysaccharide biosynthesis protein [Myroides sp. N17-2]|uniref:lipopolysaccharide biosynthesis protein n=1 Tax=Myroides sp. N17-2 TaxID=2030799 RepID=UPI000EFAE54D|nr:polysaccharide biosynthesis C-terminal domain-containing protein [Myroides sp. N17-2]